MLFIIKVSLFFLNINFVCIAWTFRFSNVVVTTRTLPNARILNDGNIMPIVGLGTFTAKRNHYEMEQAVIWAIEAGYRHIDTSPNYEVEDLIGKAVINVTKRGIVTREDLFITTKLEDCANSTEDVIPSLKKSLQRLQMNYVDLLLIHYPYDLTGNITYNIVELWLGMEEAQKLELTKSIGVSNFNSSHMNRILTYTNVRPAVNEIEVNPTYTELELAAYCQRQGITVVSYAPFGFMVPRPFNDISPPPKFNDSTLVEIASKYGKTTAQVILRYLIDRGIVPIPLSLNKEHIEENINVFDFSLTSEEIYIINEFNRNEKVYVFNSKTYIGLAEYFYGPNKKDWVLNC